MALVVKNELLPDILSTDKMKVTDGVTSNIIVDGVTHMDVITYPAQGEFTSGAILGLIKKPFIDFAVSCGGAGAMTADMIIAKYPEIPTSLASTLASDFAKAYGNYVIIPDGATLAITAEPIGSIFDLLIPEEADPTPNQD